MNSKLKGHLSLFIARFFSGVNASALKYLVPLWMAPLVGVSLRVVFGAIVFSIICLIKKEENNNLNIKEIAQMLLLGALCFFGNQITYISSLKYTTPISVSILSSLTPVWTLIFAVYIFKEEKSSWQKIVGLAISVCAALLNIFVKRAPELASNPHLGDLLALLSAIIYAVYLLFSKKFLDKTSNIELLKWTFIGASISAVVCDIVIYLFNLNIESNLSFRMFEHGIQWIPILVLLFILIFPTVLTYLLIQIGLEVLPATIVGAYSNVVLITAAITSFILGQDKFSWIQLISILMFCVGLVFISYEQTKKPSTKEPLSKRLYKYL